MVRHRTTASGGRGGHPGLHVRGIGSTRIMYTSNTRGGFDGPSNLPTRQTAGFGRQSVTLVHTTSKDTRPAPQTEIQRSSMINRKEKPKQVFWAKRLEGLRAMVIRPGQRIEQALPEPLSFSGRILPIGPNVTEEVTLSSLAALLHRPTSRLPITGQTATRQKLDSNAGVYTNPDQPLMQAIVVTDHEISMQERRVVDARRRLEEALKHFG